MKKNTHQEKTLKEGKVPGAVMAQVDTPSIPNITLNVKNLHLHFDERMDSRTYYGGQPWADYDHDEDCCDVDCCDKEGFDVNCCGDCCGCDGCDDYDDDERDFSDDSEEDDEVNDRDKGDEGEDDEDPFHKSFSFDEVAEIVGIVTNIGKKGVTRTLEQYSRMKKAVPAGNRSEEKGENHEHR